MTPPERTYTSVVAIVAVADEVADELGDELSEAEVVEEMDARSTNAHTSKCTIIPPKHAENEPTLKVIQIPPGTMSGLATPAVSQDTSKPTASTSNLSGINSSTSIKALNLPRILQQKIAT
jgi:hypothetical protein